MEHNTYLDNLRDVFRVLGYSAQREFPTPEGPIDLVLIKEGELITIEFERLGQDPKINLDKCLLLKPKKHIHIVSTRKQYELLSDLEVDESVVNILPLKGLIEEVTPTVDASSLIFKKADVINYIAQTWNYSTRHVRRLIELKVAQGRIVEKGKLLIVKKGTNIESVILDMKGT